VHHNSFSPGNAKRGAMRRKASCFLREEICTYDKVVSVTTLRIRFSCG